MVVRRPPNQEWCRDWSQSRFDSASTLFPLLSSSSPLFLSTSITPQCWNPFLSSISHLFIETKALGTMGARPSELRLTPEVTGSPRRASSFSLKSFEGPGEPKASLRELGSRKLNKKILLPLVFGIFLILDQKIEWSFVLCGNWCRTTQFD